MLSGLKNKMMLPGFAVLAVGIVLLVFTFVSAYGFLAENLSIITSGDLAQTFGDTLAPLIATCIRVMYLGVMGWIGSVLTIRGVTLVTRVPEVPRIAQAEKVKAGEKAKVAEKAEPEKVEPEKREPEKAEKELKKPEAEQPESKAPAEPEFLVMIPDEAVQGPQQTGQAEHKQE
jgi:hypothetical protein